MSEAWVKALRFAALPGAEIVTFERMQLLEDGTPTTRYTLRSVSKSGETIGDDRDYDLLKAVMQPLERLADSEPHAELKLELVVKTGLLRRPGSE
ncbi:MAG: hypothetical protein AAFV59_00960 [Pseudomonadota bacterium]